VAELAVALRISAVVVAAGPVPSPHGAHLRGPRTRGVAGCCVGAWPRTEVCTGRTWYGSRRLAGVLRRCRSLDRASSRRPPSMVDPAAVRLGDPYLLRADGFGCRRCKPAGTDDRRVGPPSAELRRFRPSSSRGQPPTHQLAAGYHPGRARSLYGRPSRRPMIRQAAPLGWHSRSRGRRAGRDHSVSAPSAQVSARRPAPDRYPDRSASRRSTCPKPWNAARQVQLQDAGTLLHRGADADDHLDAGQSCPAAYSKARATACPWSGSGRNQRLAHSAAAATSAVRSSRGPRAITSQVVRSRHRAYSADRLLRPIR